MAKSKSKKFNWKEVRPQLTILLMMVLFYLTVAGYKKTEAFWAARPFLLPIIVIVLTAVICVICGIKNKNKYLLILPVFFTTTIMLFMLCAKNDFPLFLGSPFWSAQTRISYGISMKRSIALYWTMSRIARRWFVNGCLSISEIWTTTNLWIYLK